MGLSEDLQPDLQALPSVLLPHPLALQALPHEDFPDLAAGDFPNRFEVAAADLKALIEKTRFAISTEETRYYLNGIYFHEVAAAGMLRAVATDGHRLAQAQIARPEGAKGMPGVIVLHEGAWMDLDENGVDRSGNPDFLTLDEPSPAGAFAYNTVLCNIRKTNLQHKPGWDQLATSRAQVFRRDL